MNSKLFESVLNEGALAGLVTSRRTEIDNENTRTRNH